jgi:hypothetical protein
MEDDGECVGTGWIFFWYVGEVGSSEKVNWELYNSPGQ